MGRKKLLRTPVVVVTLVVLLVAYLLTGFLANFVPGGAQTYELLVLDVREVLSSGQIWRLLSYGLLHNLADPLHLLLNGLMLWFFGRDVELRFGPARFIGFMACAVLVGGLFVTAGHVLGIGSPFVLGFSAAVEASVVAWALFNRDAPVLLFFAVPMRGIHMLVLAVLMWMMQAVGTSGVSASAHLGGILTGVVTWFVVAKRNRIRLLFMRRGPKLTVVPPKDRWVN